MQWRADTRRSNGSVRRRALAVSADRNRRTVQVKRRDFLRRLPLIGAGAVVAPAVVAEALQPKRTSLDVIGEAFQQGALTPRPTATEISVMNATGRSWPPTHYHPDKETCVRQHAENMKKAEQKMFWPKETV